MIEFRSDGQNQRQGFAATFEFINVRHHTVSVPDSSTPTIPRIPTVDPPPGKILYMCSIHETNFVMIRTKKNLYIDSQGWEGQLNYYIPSVMGMLFYRM